MNVRVFPANLSDSRPARTSVTARMSAGGLRGVRPARRERDFGIGYGNSSGYATGRRYAGDLGCPRFRVV